MSTKNPLFDDLAGLMTGAMGAAKTASDEIRTATQARMHSMVADMDLVGREEAEALKALLEQAIARIDELERRLDAFEAKSD
ncbi:MAG: pyrroline-5-carboxylate reductase [Hyphomonadaceae bacterium]|nr:pyrroline-5-carboxylate reductase [Hyphomonadaceae bacterium]OUX93099.1 MAG: pyrroline-5-carboxylate reductase [Hyphomonas sp. TMED17]CAI8318485.1 MAG: Uncharacterised protein [Hyphomonas sp. TMED17]